MSDCYAPEPIVLDDIDSDGDGYADTTLLDTDGDGYADTALTDADDDGYGEVASFDNNPDGEFVPDVISVDLDSNGTADITYDDLDFDGVFDTAEHVSVPLIESNPYSPNYTGGETYHSDDTEAGEVFGSEPVTEAAEEVGSVIFGSGGESLTSLPGGGLSFSGGGVDFATG